MNRSDANTEVAHECTPEFYDVLVETLISAASLALQEMASTEVGVRDISNQPQPPVPGGIAVLFGRCPLSDGPLVAYFPPSTATAIAGRILVDVAQELNQDLIADCMGEVGNVIAGQAKALLAETLHQCTFVMPPIVVQAENLTAEQNSLCRVITFGSELGNFTIQLFLGPLTFKVASSASVSASPLPTLE